MKLHELTKSKGLSKKNNRRGRGDATGRGNYSGKGNKGQKARSGGGVRPGFEGGQTSLFMRLPKLKGFKRHYKLVTEYVAINLETLEKCDAIKTGTTISREALLESGLIGVNEKVKLLARGTLSKKLVIEGVNAASKTAIAAVEAAGGSVSL